MTKFRPPSEDELLNSEDEAIVFLPTTSPDILELDDNRLDFFRGCYPQPRALPPGDQVEGKSPRKWYAGAPVEKPVADLERFGNGVDRSRLLALCSDPTIPTLDLCIAIFAWGGMRDSNRDHLFKRAVAPWLNVAKQIRDGQLTRQDAFDAFALLNHKRFLVGVKPAYYTKLIYFLMPREGAGPIGYIMDQWLGCSINLICKQEVVRLDSGVYWANEGRGRARQVVQKAVAQVSPLNTGKHYERFCRAVEMVAARMGSGWTPEAAELALMSRGGVPPAPWREYVIKNRLFGLGVNVAG